MTSPIEAEAMEMLSAEAAFDVVRSGDACIVDVRPEVKFAAGHARGAISLPYSAKGLATRLRTALPAETKVVLVADEDDRAGARYQLLEGGWTVLGTLGGLDDWATAGLACDSLEVLTAEEVGDHQRAPGFTVIDVREPLEWSTGHVPGALLITLGALAGEMGSLDPSASVAAICEGGTRSSTAASLLKRAGFARVANVLGGIAGYRRSGLPLAFPPSS